MEEKKDKHIEELQGRIDMAFDELRDHAKELEDYLRELEEKKEAVIKILREIQGEKEELEEIEMNTKEELKEINKLYPFPSTLFYAMKEELKGFDKEKAYLERTMNKKEK
jgi:NADH:ubiquinone oxidoreductase subunit E